MIQIVFENMKLKYDMLHECDVQNRGIFTLVDFKQTFDTLHWNFIQRVFELSNYGEKI